MNWACEFTSLSSKQLKKLPKDYQDLVGEALDEMKENPFSGDICPIKSGKFKGMFRRRVGKYRIIFEPYNSKNIILIAGILRRSDTTYD